MEEDFFVFNRQRNGDAQLVLGAGIVKIVKMRVTFFHACRVKISRSSLFVLSLFLLLTGTHPWRRSK
jgi:hypothetical protein